MPPRPRFSHLLPALLPLLALASGCPKDPEAKVTVKPNAGTVEVGKTLSLVADSTSAADTSFTWRSSDLSRATVHAQGIVTGAAVGDVTITATANRSGASGTASISVTLPALEEGESTLDGEPAQDGEAVGEAEPLTEAETSDEGEGSTEAEPAEEGEGEPPLSEGEDVEGEGEPPLPEGEGEGEGVDGEAEPPLPEGEGEGEDTDGEAEPLQSEGEGEGEGEDVDGEAEPSQPEGEGESEGEGEDVDGEAEPLLPEGEGEGEETDGEAEPSLPEGEGEGEDVDGEAEPPPPEGEEGEEVDGEAEPPPPEGEEGEGPLVPDAALAGAIRSELGLDSDYVLEESDLAGLTDLPASSLGIWTIAGLEHATNLATLSLRGNNLIDVTPLAGLTSLATLDLSYNGIADHSTLESLTGLTSLEFSYATPDDLTELGSLLNALPSLQTLGIWGVTFTDLSPLATLLTGYPNVLSLELVDDNIGDLTGLDNVTHLRALDLRGNAITDLSAVASMTTLYSLALSYNSITDLGPIEGLVELALLLADNNDLAGIDALVGNLGLGSGDNVDLRGNPLSQGAICYSVPAVAGRGANVFFDGACPEEGELEGEFTAVPDIDVTPAIDALSCDTSKSEGLEHAWLGAAASATSSKLTVPETIEAQLAARGSAEVIVLLEAGKSLDAIDWNNPADLLWHQDAIRGRRAYLLMGLDQEDVKVFQHFDNVPAFAAEVSPAGLKQLLGEATVTAIEPVVHLEAQLRQGIAVINAETARATYNGQGVAIAVIDSGVDYTHPNLGGGAFPNEKVIGGTDIGDGDSDPFPSSGVEHGTEVAGVAAGGLPEGEVGDFIGGVASGAKLYALRANSTAEPESFSTVAATAALDWCVSHKNDDPANPILVANISLGSGQYTDFCDDAFPAYALAASTATAAGITIVGASGNNGYCNAVGLPACFSDIIAVGAVWDDDLGTSVSCVDDASCAQNEGEGEIPCPAGYHSLRETVVARAVPAYSNSAPLIDLFGPSHSAHTTDIAGVSGADAGDYTTNFGGTSCATPYVAGAVACLQSAAFSITGDYLSPGQVLNLLRSTGPGITDPKAIPALTRPLVDLQAAIDAIASLDSARVVTVANTGEQPLSVTGLSLVPSLSWIELLPSKPFIVYPGESSSVSIALDCGSVPAGTFVFQLGITSNDPDEGNIGLGFQVDGK